mgnify:CR=1 FL=1
MTTRPGRRRSRRDGGSATVELAMAMPAIVLVQVVRAGELAPGMPFLVVSGLLGGEQELAVALSIVGFTVSALGCVGFFVAMRLAPRPIR